MKKLIYKLHHYYSALGFRGVVVFLFAKLSGTKPVFRATVRGVSHPVFVRIATTDASVLRQVLIEQQYNVPVPMDPTVIVDAGANIGLSAVFFANRYPRARIVALEPEESNFELLKKNVAKYPQITPLNAALWNEEREISLIDPGAGSHGFQTQQQDEGHLGQGSPEYARVQALTVESLLRKMKWDHIDILKIDIEGSEKEVFEGSAIWIDRVNVIMAEVHDHLKLGCHKAFMESTRSFQEPLVKGETIVRIR